MHKDTLRAYSRLVYGDLKGYLIALKRLEPQIASSGLDRKIRTLRTNKLKEWRELREAALFAYLMSERLGTPIRIAKGENSDYDFVASWRSGDATHFAPVQLKEVVPEYVNPAATIEGVIASLTKYTSSGDLTVAIHLNKRTEFDIREIHAPRLAISSLWMFGSISADRSRRGLWGDLLDQPTGSEHAYPTA